MIFALYRNSDYENTQKSYLSAKLENEISIILQKKDLIIGKTELDITDEIIKIINVEIKEFKIK